MMDRLASKVGDYDAKVEMRELAWKDDLRRVGAEHADALRAVASELTNVAKVLEVVRDDVKDALEIRRRSESKDSTIVAVLKIIRDAPTTKFVLLTVIAVLFFFIAFERGWIHLK